MGILGYIVFNKVWCLVVPRIALGLTYMDNIHPMDGMESSTILLILSLLLLLSNVSPMPNKTRNKAQQNNLSFFSFTKF
jgi:multisubunit Na+/H+ antiporter MnhF subunit